MEDAELDRRLRHAQEGAGEALRCAMQAALRDIGIVEPVRLEIDGDRQSAVCRSQHLARLEFGAPTLAPSPVLGPLGRQMGERIAGWIAAALRGEGA